MSDIGQELTDILLRLTATDVELLRSFIRMQATGEAEDLGYLAQKKAALTAKALRILIDAELIAEMDARDAISKIMELIGELEFRCKQEEIHK
ncbi:Uncharacterised protein [uncultured archaeon]|nr:Uncharacterised protein [uncultured archaeon]